MRKVQLIPNLKNAGRNFSLVALLAGCADAPPHDALPIPAQFESPAAAAWPARDWYRGFSSDEMNRFVALAANGNWNLAAAKARLTQADARARQAGAAILPGIDARGNANYLAGHSSEGSGHETDWSALLSASYEVDLWGKVRSGARAAGYLAAASAEERDALELTTLAGVANGYFQVLALRERVSIARANRQAASDVLAVIQARFDVGMATPVELATQRAALANTELVIPELERQGQEAQGALAILLGRAPEGFTVIGQPLDTLTEPRVAPGIPAQLLTRRPDLRVAESNLLAAHANLAAARAALFPSVTLTAAAGAQNPALAAAVLTVPGSGPTVSLGVTLVQTIFDRGRLRALRTEAQARDEELLAAYRSAILDALNDVENSLGAMRHLDLAREYQIQSLTQSERALQGATLRYREGAGDFLTLLDAQRAVYAARDQYVQYKVARYQALVGLCKALGGGWGNSDQ